MTPVDTLGEPVTVVDTLGEPVVLINNDGTPAFLAYSAKTYLGGVAPYHWLDFITNRALYAGADVGNVTQATGYSFTRASDGYYTNSDGTLTLFASGALRRGDRGVLIEGSRTNLLVRSQEFQTTWSAVGLQAFGSGSTANAGVSPDGTTTADLITESSANSRHFIFQLQSVSASTTYAYSVYLKYSTRRYCVVSLKSYTGSVDVVSYSQVVDVQNRTLGAATNTTGSPTNTSSTIELLANGWCRVNITMNTGVGGVLMYSSVCLSDSATPSYVAEAPSYTGDGTSGVLAWQADLQAGAFPSSPIVTVAAASTRAADVLTYTAGVSYGLSLWAEFERAVDTGVQETYLHIDDGTGGGADVFQLNVTNGDLGQAAMNSTAGGGAQAAPTVAGAISINAVTKLAGRAETNSVNAARSGTLATLDTTATLPVTPTRLIVGTRQNGASPSFGYIRRVAIIQGAGTDAQLQSMTGS
jgi:hypothetical protein